MEALFHRLSHTVVQSHTLEQMARPLLDMLQQITHLDSTYLTRIDLPRSQQHVLYSCNRGTLDMPEGLTVPWDDTLCRRALESKQPYTPDVAACWGDSEAARALGLRTYVSTPVRLPQGQLYGTLCAASASSQPLSEQAMATLQLFAGLLGQQVEREMLLSELQQRNHELSTYALTDALTGLPNRRALDEELARMWARAKRTGAYVLLGFIDMDAFKPINDQHGHEAGDQLLRTVARQLRGALRDSDYAARIGGDEFVMLGVGPLVSGPLPDSALAELQHRLEQSTVCDVALPIQQLLHYPGASVGVVAIDPRLTSSAEALHQADAAMYRAKKPTALTGAALIPRSAQRWPLQGH